MEEKTLQAEQAYTFTVNGEQVTCREDISLLRFLRDCLRLHSVKDGCSQGACGTCTVIVDGVAKKACVFKTSKLQGANIITVEGLDPFEKEAFVSAFGDCGAVQCGFCIPGMVMSAKALLDQNNNPTEEEIKKALRGNICRCTGYRKIIEAIAQVAKILRGEAPLTTPVCEREEGARDKEEAKVDLHAGMGSAVARIDVRAKVLGYGEYVDDMVIDNMAYCSAVRTKYPRARILKIDTSKAEKIDGVIGILRAEDVPNNKVGHIIQDWDVMIKEGEITRCAGDAIVLVVAEDEKTLELAKAAVEIEYEELQTVSTIQEAMAEDAPKVHEKGNLCASRHVKRGNAQEALANAKYKVTHHYSTPFTEHAFLEPECAIAMPYKDGVKVYTTDQGVYDTRKEIAIMFGWEPERVVVENKLIGGGFGGKEDVSVQHIACLAAHKFNRIVKAKFTRDESLSFHPKRHPMEADFTLACDENGIFQALVADIYFDTGAYASLCGPVLERACTHAVGPYCYQNTDIRGYGYYTNNPPAGAFRGFGVCQSNFALEMNINLLAEMVGISPWEIRYRNAIEPGKYLPNGQLADQSTALKETLEAVKEQFEANIGRAGIACAMKNAGVGVGLPDKGRCRLVVKDGVIENYAASSDIGQGYMQVALQMMEEALGLGVDKYRIMPPNTETSPDSGTTSGSRQTLLTGEAVRSCSLQLKEDLDRVGGDLAKLEGKEYFYEYFEPTDPLTSDKPNPKSHIAYAYATHLAVLDEEGKIKDIYAAHDSGKVVNPISIQGQIEGGVLMSMGYALTEDFKLDRSKVKAKFGNLGLLKATDIPNLEAIYVEKPELLEVAYGAKGIGEIASIPTAPAIAGAYYAMDGELRTSLPLKDTAYSKPKKQFKKDV